MEETTRAEQRSKVADLERRVVALEESNYELRRLLGAVGAVLDPSVLFADK